MPLGLKDSLLIVIDAMIQWILSGLLIDSNSRKGGNMIVLTIMNRKSGKKKLETFTSMDKAETRMVGITSAAKPKEKLVAVSYDTKREEELCQEQLRIQQERDGER